MTNEPAGQRSSLGLMDPADPGSPGRPTSSGTLVGSACLAGACLCLGLAYLLPAQVYPRLAVLPADPKINQVQIAQHGAALVPDPSAAAGVREVRDVGVRITTYVTRAPEAATGSSVVWTLGTQFTVEGHGLLNARVETVSLDKHNARPTNCCGDRLVTDQAQPQGVSLWHEGYTAFPFDLQKHSYRIWDVQLKRAVPAAYLGEEQRDGLRTYVLRTNTPFEKIGTQELPGALFDRSDPSVTADAEYSDSRTYWVEPATGNVIGLHEEFRQRFVYQDRTVTALSASLDSPRLSEDNLDETRQGAIVLPWLRGRASYLLAPIGLLLLLGWVLTLRRARRERLTDHSAGDPAADQ